MRTFGWGDPVLHPACWRMHPQLKKIPSLQDPSDIILQARLQVFMALSEDQKEKHMQQFCNLLESYGITPIEERGKGELLQNMWVRDLPPGCYTIDNSQKNIPTVEIKHVNSLRTSSNALIKVIDSSLVLNAPQIDLSMIWLQTTKILNPVPIFMNPPEYNAITFPIVMGVSVEKKTVELAKGTHFFVTHLIYKKANPGKANPVNPTQGLSGPNLTVTSQQSINPFVFLSIGGIGQQAAPPSPGGHGDVSMIDYENLSSWLALKYQTDDTKQSALMLPITVIEFLSLQEVEYLFKSAIQDSSGKPIIYTMPSVASEILTPDQKDKILRVCEAWAQKTQLTQEEWVRCFNDHLAPMAVSQINEQIEQAKQNGNVDIKKPLTQLKASLRFELPDGELGPNNISGQQGHAGVLKKISKDQK